MKITRTVLILFAVILGLVLGATFFPDSALFNILTFDPDEAFENFEDARDDLEEIGVALGRYRTTSHTYPSTEQGLAALVDRPTVPPVPDAWAPKLDEIPLDPWGTPYVYSHDPAAAPDATVRLFSLGPDGVESDDDIESDVEF